MRGRAERGIERALQAIGRALSDVGAPWMVIGGLAVIAAGVRRMTTDVDVTVRGDAAPVEALLPALARRGIEPRIDDAAAFARENLVLLLRHRPTGVSLDLSLAWSAFEHEALAERREASFGAVVVPMATPEALVVYKAIAGRATDRSDIEALVALHPEIDIARARRRVKQLAELAGAPELIDGFEAAVARGRKVGGRTPRPRRRR